MHLQNQPTPIFPFKNLSRYNYVVSIHGKLRTLYARMKVLFQNIKITEWITAIGAIVAIVATIVTFYKLFQRDLDKEKQIQSLSELAQESVSQTKALENQVQAMKNQVQELRIANELTLEELKINKEVFKIQSEHLKEFKEGRSKEILPVFVVQDVEVISNNYAHATLLNKGGTATQFRFLHSKLVKGGTSINEILNYGDGVPNVPNGGTVTIVLRYLDHPVSRGHDGFHDTVEVHFGFYFFDVDKNKFSQRIEGKIGPDFNNLYESAVYKYD